MAVDLRAMSCCCVGVCVRSQVRVQGSAVVLPSLPIDPVADLLQPCSSLTLEREEYLVIYR